jgi:hypothetical protein
MNENLNKIIEFLIKESDIDRPCNGGKVSFSDCVKLNNELPNDGCSVGAIDNVVKIDNDEKK